MVGGFNRNYSTAGLRIMFANIFGEFDFSAGWSEDQNFAGIADGVQYMFQEFSAFMDMAAADRIGLVMNMPRWQDDFIQTGKAEVEDPGLQMVDPDDRVKMLPCSNPLVSELDRSSQLVFLRGIKVRACDGVSPAKMIVNCPDSRNVLGRDDCGLPRPLVEDDAAKVHYALTHGDAERSWPPIAFLDRREDAIADMVIVGSWIRHIASKIYDGLKQVGARHYPDQLLSA